MLLSARFKNITKFGVGFVALGTLLLGGSMGLFSAHAAGALATDVKVSTHSTATATTLKSPTFSTTQTNELLLAFIGSDGPSATPHQTVTSLSGAGVTWTLRARSNTQNADSEIWQAVAPSKLTSVAITATRALSGYHGSITIVSFTGADIAANGATATGSAATGAPSLKLTTTRASSWVWGTGADWDKATARTLGSNQTMADQFVDTTTGDTYWTQSQTSPTPASGTSVTINDTAPVSDRWNLALIEVLPAATNPPDTTPPTTPANLGATSSGNQINLTWNASTDNIGVVAYDVYRSTTAGFTPNVSNKIARPTSTAYSDPSLSPGTYYYLVQAEDAAANFSSSSNQTSATIAPAPDTAPPSVPTGLTATAISTTQVNLGWTASTDNVGVTGYQVWRDGTQVTTVTGTSYSDTGLSPSTTYTYTVKAYDAAGSVSAASGTAAVTTPAAAATYSLFAPTAMPANPSVNDPGAVEVGMKFRSDVSGSITAIRFYKDASNTGTHIGHLWSLDGTNLAMVTFSGETASGWQQANLASPVAVTANTTYIVSYFAPAGHYAGDNGYFTSAFDNAPLHGLQDAASGGNGVYFYGSAGGFPTNTYASSNYWVDVVLSTTAQAPDTQAPTAPTNLTATAVSPTQANLSWTASSDNVGVARYQVFRDGAATPLAEPTTTSFGDATLSANTTYSYIVKAVDGAGNVSGASASVSVTTPAGTGSCTTGQAPANDGSCIALPAGTTAMPFDDEFNSSSVDPNLWTLMNVHADSSNGEPVCYQPANVAVSGGSLTETAKLQTVPSCPNDIEHSPPTGTSSTNYSSGAVQMKSFNYTYGTIEVRAKFAGTSGLWPAIWMMGYNCQQPSWLTYDMGPNRTCFWQNPGSEEIDIAEYFAWTGTQIKQTLWAGANGGAVGNNGSTNVSDPSQNWHTYSLVWTPTSLTWKIDGVTTFVTPAGTHVPQTGEFLILNTSLTGDYNCTSNCNLPQTTQIDYVRVFQ